MKLNISVTVTSDDGSQSVSTENEVSVATRLHGLDPSSAKQDFIQQAENLIRIIGESQIPAMYADIMDHVDSAPDVTEPTESEKALREKLKSMKARKNAQGQEPETQGEEAE